MLNMTIAGRRVLLDLDVDTTGWHEDRYLELWDALGALHLVVDHPKFREEDDARDTARAAAAQGDAWENVRVDHRLIARDERSSTAHVDPLPDEGVLVSRTERAVPSELTPASAPTDPSWPIPPGTNATTVVVEGQDIDTDTPSERLAANRAVIDLGHDAALGRHQNEDLPTPATFGDIPERLAESHAVLDEANGGPVDLRARLGQEAVAVPAVRSEHDNLVHRALFGRRVSLEEFGWLEAHPEIIDTVDQGNRTRTRYVPGDELRPLSMYPHMPEDALWCYWSTAERGGQMITWYHAGEAPEPGEAIGWLAPPKTMTREEELAELDEAVTSRLQDLVDLSDVAGGEDLAGEPLPEEIIADPAIGLADPIPAPPKPEPEEPDATLPPGLERPKDDLLRLLHMLDVNDGALSAKLDGPSCARTISNTLGLRPPMVTTLLSDAGELIDVDRDGRQIVFVGLTDFGKRALTKWQAEADQLVLDAERDIG